MNYDREFGKRFRVVRIQGPQAVQRAEHAARSA
jgi:hypothetical protein